jgi:predicted porin
MGPKFLSSAVLATALAWAASPAQAVEMSVGDASVVAATAPEPLVTSSFSSINTLAAGVTPVAGSFGVRSLSGGLGLAGVTDAGGETTARLDGGDVGVFAGMAERPSIFAPSTATAWNVGGSFGYAGFYLRAGLSATTPLGPLQGTQGWQAGFGFTSGALDLRLTYLTALTGNFGMAERELDSQQWTLGGIYRVSSTVRLNADAFYGLRDSRSGMFFTPQAAAGNQAPQGTGARVGIQLRF